VKAGVDLGGERHRVRSKGVRTGFRISDKRDCNSQSCHAWERLMGEMPSVPADIHAWNNLSTSRNTPPDEVGPAAVSRAASREGGLAAGFTSILPILAARPLRVSIAGWT